MWPITHPVNMLAEAQAFVRERDRKQKRTVNSGSAFALLELKALSVHSG